MKKQKNISLPRLFLLSYFFSLFFFFGLLIFFSINFVFFRFIFFSTFPSKLIPFPNLSTICIFSDLFFFVLLIFLESFGIWIEKYTTCLIYEKKFFPIRKNFVSSETQKQNFFTHHSGIFSRNLKNNFFSRNLKAKFFQKKMFFFPTSEKNFFFKKNIFFSPRSEKKMEFSLTHSVLGHFFQKSMWRHGKKKHAPFDTPLSDWDFRLFEVCVCVRACVILTLFFSH